MKVAELMTRDVRTCQPTDSMNDAARIMWEADCGCVPVVDHDGKVLGMITDRDICMAAYTQGRRLMHMAVESAASKSLVTIGEQESVHRAEELMQSAQVRRLPVVDTEGKLVGLLSISDLASRAHDGQLRQHIMGALAAVSKPRSTSSGAEGHAANADHRATANMKIELDNTLAHLRTLRDEVRVQLHLGSLDLKDQWRKLEPHLGDIEKKAEELTESSRAAVIDAVKRLEHIRSSLSHRN